MQTDNHNLLQALGCNIPQSDADVNKYPCPLHKDGVASLRIHTNPNTGNSYFECVNPMCRFYGDAVTLVAAAKQLTITDAVAMFKPGGPLAHVLKEPLLDAEVEAYTENRLAQSRIQAYLSRCQQAARQTPDKIKLRAGLSQNCLRVLPQEVGLLIRGDDIPPPFREFNKTKYHRASHIVYPFTYNGEVTHVQVQDTTSLFAKNTVTVTRSDIGVFMERFTETPLQLLATFDPRTAAIIYGNCTAETTKKPGVIATAGFPLPESFATVQTIYLLSTPDNPLTLTDALQTLSAPEFVAGADKQPKMKVWWWPRGAEQLTAEQVRVRFGSSENTVSLDSWVLREMDRAIQKGGAEDVFKALNAATLSDEVRIQLVQTAQAKSLSKTLIDTLQAITTISAARIILGNGKQIRRTATSLKAIARSGDEAVLSNVGLNVNHKVRTYSGEEVAVCTITVNDIGIPPTIVNLPESSWRKASSIQRIVSKAFADRGQTPYIALYDLPGYDWRDIICKLAEQCELHREVRELGLDDLNDIHLPNFVIRTAAKTIEGQKQIFTLPKETLQIYGGLPGGVTLSAREPFRNLLEHCDNLYVAAFTAGVMHVLYQMIRSLHQPEQAKLQAHKHLFYVESVAGIWQPIFRQLAALFSNSEFVPTLSYTDPTSTLNEYRQLGTLPLIARVPTLHGDKFPRLINDNSVSLIGLVDSSTAAIMHTHLNSTYVAPLSDKPEDTMIIAAQDIEDLRQAFGTFVLDYATSVKIDSDYRSGSVPAQVAYESVCKLLDIVPSPLVQKITRTSYPGASMTGLTTFFDILHRVLNTMKKPILCIVHGKPQNDVSFTARGQHVFVMDDVVVISQIAVEIINHASGITGHFDRTQLTQELKERNLLVDCPPWLSIDTNRCWVISRKTWDAQVVRPEVWLPQLVTSGNVIQLKQIA